MTKKAKNGRRVHLRTPERVEAQRKGGLADSLRSDDVILREFIADLYAAMSMMRLLLQEIATALSLTTAEYSVLLAVWYLDRAGSKTTRNKTVRAISDHLHVAAASVTSEVRCLVNRFLRNIIDHGYDAIRVVQSFSKTLQSRGRR